MKWLASSTTRSWVFTCENNVFQDSRERSMSEFQHAPHGGSGVMLSDATRSVARKIGLVVVPCQSQLGFTAARENDDRFVFVLNSGEWSIYRAADVALAESGSGPASFETALRLHLRLPSRRTVPRDLTESGPDRSA